MCKISKKLTSLRPASCPTGFCGSLRENQENFTLPFFFAKFNKQDCSEEVWDSVERSSAPWWSKRFHISARTNGLPISPTLCINGKVGSFDHKAWFCFSSAVFWCTPFEERAYSSISVCEIELAALFRTRKVFLPDWTENIFHLLDSCEHNYIKPYWSAVIRSTATYSAAGLSSCPLFCDALRF